MEENEEKNEIIAIDSGKKYKIILGFVAVTLIALVIRSFGMHYESGDMKDFLYIWFEFLKAKGGFKALNIAIGDYNAPYLTILAFLTYLPVSPLLSIKVVSIIFDFVLAVSCMKLTKEVLKDKYTSLIGLLAYTLVILLPTVILNSAWWGQCDSIYASFIVISLIYLMKGKYIRSFIFLGISFSFKLQFIFVLPVYVLYYISKRKVSKIYYFLIIPLTNLIMCLPAILLGRSVVDCFSVYLIQTSEYGHFICMNFPGVYNIFCKIPKNYLIPTPNEYISKIMIGVTLLLFFIMAVYVLIKKVKFDNKLILKTALCSIMICTFFLPHMHDRYMYVADVLSVIFFIVNGKKKIYVPICISLCSLLVYRRVLIDAPIDAIYLKSASIINFIVIILLNISLWKNFKRQAENKKLIES